MSLFKKSIILGIVLFVGLTVSVFARDFVIKVHNLTGYNLKSLYITPTEADTWGDNLVADQPLSDGSTTDITFTIVGNDFIWDMRATDFQGDTVNWKRLNLRNVTDIYLWVTGNGNAEARLY